MIGDFPLRDALENTALSLVGSFYRPSEEIARLTEAMNDEPDADPALKDIARKAIAYLANTTPSGLRVSQFISAQLDILSTPLEQQCIGCDEDTAVAGGLCESCMNAREQWHAIGCAARCLGRSSSSFASDHDDYLRSKLPYIHGHWKTLMAHSWWLQGWHSYEGAK